MEATQEPISLNNSLALRDINLNIKHGEFVCIIGDVGSGKSSLLNAIIGDLQYVDPGFLSENGDTKVNEQEFIDKVREHSQRRIDSADSPVYVSH